MHYCVWCDCCKLQRGNRDLSNIVKHSEMSAVSFPAFSIFSRTGDLLSHTKTIHLFSWQVWGLWSNCTKVASSLDDRDNFVDHVVCLKAEFLWHTVLSNENGEFYTYGIYPYLNRSVCLLMVSPTWWRLSFCSSGSSLVCSMMTWRTALARISNVRSPMLTMGFPLISGPKNAFLWNLINHVTITFRDTFSSTNLYYSYFTRPLLHAVYNTWLTVDSLWY